VVQALQSNFEINSARGHHVLYLEVSELDRILVDSLDCLGILLCCVFRLALRLSSCDDHLAILEYECSCPYRVLQSHDQCSESLRVILCVTTLDTYLSQIKVALQVGCRN